MDTGSPSAGTETAGTDAGQELARLRSELEGMQRALDTRDVIGMAKGILVARERCSPDEAFQILVRASQRENRKLADLARWLVQQAQEPTEKRRVWS